MRAVQRGAAGIVFKSDDIHQIVDIVERVHLADATGTPAATLRSVPSSDLETPTVTSTTGRNTDALGRFLTDREHEVLQHLVRGDSGKALADQMGIKYSTLRSHIQHLLEKLGVHSRLEAVAFAIEHDLCA